ncbi:MAG: aryl-sulfate sulfotransferase [Crocinitomicaceae bacterium]|nr:aryl-sulfate sulfotransferase [Crocinitomicaceae bacterium]
MKRIFIVLFLSCSFISSGQPPTLGLVLSTDSVSGGYTLFSPDDRGEVYLIDNCGKVINSWFFNEPPGLTSYLLENGNLLFAGKDSLYIRDWNDNEVWTYAAAANGVSQHHDIEPLPNGNVLCVVTEPKTPNEQTLSGKDPALLAPNFKLDFILELEPVGVTDVNVVWEWHFWDHLVQEYDSTKLNYGIVVDHPELIHFNFDQGNSSDWTHVNSVDYNETLDQILISGRQMGEIYIIDHSTTTNEAASHTGGNSDRGGDFLWRWGNPQVYQQGSVADQKLFGQHDAKWVEGGYLHDGKISVFNNGGDGSFNFSSIHLIEPEMNGSEYLMSNNQFTPSDFYYTWTDVIQGDVLLSDIKSGVKALSNGGFLICETQLGRFIEIDADGNVVWMYKNPMGGGVVYSQFDILTEGDNTAFRADKYLPDYPGILANTLTVQSIIENENSLSNNCTDYTVIEENELHIGVVNPVQNGQITFIEPIFEGSILLMNLQGKLVKHWDASLEEHYSVREIPDGIYLLNIVENDIVHSQRIIISN